MSHHLSTIVATGSGVVMTAASLVAQIPPKVGDAAGRMVQENPGQSALVIAAGAFATMFGSVAIQMLKSAREVRADRRRDREERRDNEELKHKNKELQEDIKTLQKSMERVLKLTAIMGGVKGQNDAAMEVMRASGFLLPESLCPKVLIVEDVPDAARTLMRTLQREEFVVSHVATLTDAIAAWRREKPDWVLLDRNLPDGDGLTLLELIRDENADTRSAVITASCDAKSRAEIDALRPDLFLPKPFDVDLLISGIRNALSTADFPVFKEHTSPSGSGIIAVVPLPKPSSPGGSRGNR